MSLKRALLGACVCAAACGTSGELVRTPSAPSSSTLDPHIQEIAQSELDRVVREWQPEEAVVVVTDLTTGSVLAMAGRGPNGKDPTIASQRAWITGSTLKTFTLGAALEDKTIAPDVRLDCRPRAYGHDVLEDAGECPGTLTLPDVLATSSNVGSARVFDTIGLSRFTAWLRRLHFGEHPGVIPEVASETSIRAAALGTGELATATPLQMIAAYGAVFNGGEYVAPTFQRSSTSKRERVFRAATTQALISMLEGVVTSPVGTGAKAAVPGVRVAGKTGTAELDPSGQPDRYYASFVGSVLDREPRFVALVGLVAPREGGTGASAAAPAFARIAARLVAAH